MPFKRPLIYAVLVFLAVFSIYGVILNPDVTFSGMDFLNLGYPRVALARDAFAAGHIPLWNPWQFRGVPLLATSLGALLYPPTWLAMLCPLPWGLQFFVFLHLVIGAVGAGLLTRKILGCPLPISIFCSTAYIGSGFFLGRIEQHQVIATNALLPWLILSLLHGPNNRLFRSLCPGILLAMMLLCGHPQFALLNASGAVLFAGTPTLFTKNRPKIGLFAARVILMAIVGTGLAAAQLLPTWELGRLGERIWPWPEPLEPALKLNQLPAFFLPGWFQHLTGHPGRPFGYSEVEVYSGFLTAIFAIIGTFTTLLRRQLWAVATLITFTLTFLYALGGQTPLAPSILKLIPFLAHSRGTARILNVTLLCWALMAGIGLQFLTNGISSLLSNPSQGKAIFPSIAALILVGDLAVSQHGELSSVLVPRDTLGVSSPFTASVRKSSDNGFHPRLYRFMNQDSDFYLDNSMSAVAERIVRLQPNYSGILQVSTTDGYEEGLLPLRSDANLERCFNRNLRTDSPDAALLAFMGANQLLTEFPLPLPNSQWTAGVEITRPNSVPSVAPGTPAAYRLFQSHYSNALILSEKTINNALGLENFNQSMTSAYGGNERTHSPRNSQMLDHPLQKITPTVFERAVADTGIIKLSQSWNSITMELTPNKANQTLLLLQSPYPGWETVSTTDKSGHAIKSLCSLFSSFDVYAAYPKPRRVQLRFNPFSFRVGLFCSLLFLIFIIASTGDKITRSMPVKKENT